MEKVENKASEFLGDIRDAVADHPRKRVLNKKIDWLEDAFNFMVNFIYAEQDNLNELNEQLKGDK